MYPLSISKFKVVGDHWIGKYRVVVVTECVSAGLIQYAHAALVLDSKEPRPIYAVASEVNALATATGGGSHFLCVYDDRHGNYGSSDDWGDLEKFTQEALRLIALRFADKPDKPFDPNQPLNRLIEMVIVDDMPEVVEALKRLLIFEDDFKVVGTGANGVEALAAVKSFRPDVVLMDFPLPEMDGVDYVQQIRVEYPKTKIIFMSIHSDSDSMTQAAKAGVHDFLAKPISPFDLYPSIRSVVTGHGPTNSDFAKIVKELNGLN